MLPSSSFYIGTSLFFFLLPNVDDLETCGFNAKLPFMFVLSHSFLQSLLFSSSIGKSCQ